MSEVHAIWQTVTGRPTAVPSPQELALLRAIGRKPGHGGELARRLRTYQPNVSKRIGRLKSYGLITVDRELSHVSHHGGGSPAKVWRLTHDGRVLFEAISTE